MTRSEALFLACLCAVVLVLVGTAAADREPLLGPDEHGHWGYVLHLHEHRRLPRHPESIQPWTDVPQLLNWEAGQPPLYYLIGAMATSVFDWKGMAASVDRYIRIVWMPVGEASSAAMYEPPPEVRDGILFHPLTAKAPLLPHPRVNRTFADTEGFRHSFLVLRMLSALAWCICLLYAYRLMRLFITASAAAPALVYAALHPYPLLHAGHASNDMPAAALAAGVLYLICKLVKLGAGPCLDTEVQVAQYRTALGIGCGLGAALLCKTTTLGLLPVAGLGVAAAAWPSRNWKFGVRLLLAVFVPAMLLAGWWYVRNWQLYGDPTGLDALLLHWRTRAYTHPVQDVGLVLQAVWKRPLSSYGTSVAAIVPAPWLQLLAGTVILSYTWAGVAVAGLAVRLGVGLADRLRGRRVGWSGPWVAACLMSVLYAVLLTISWWVFNTHFYAPMPRYWFTAIPGLLLLAGTGLAQLPPLVQRVMWVVPLSAVVSALLHTHLWLMGTPQW